jgi:hypothetical protein
MGILSDLNRSFARATRRPLSVAKRLVVGHDVELWCVSASRPSTMYGRRQMTDLSRKDELVRRSEQSRRILKAADDPTTKGRIGLLIESLVLEQIKENEK